jgi:hypothetical protein
MKHQNSRREFLKRAALLPLGVAVANVWPQSARAAGDSTLKRNPGPKLKLSLNAWSYYVQLHQHLKGQGGGMSLFDLLEECARLDFNAVDPTGYFFPGYPSVPEKKFLNEFKRRAFQLGLDISGTGIRNDFAVPDMTKRAADVTRNVLRTKILAGMLDGQPKVPETMRDCPEHRALVYESGLKSIVLLKNQHAILPLNPKLKSVALIGPNAATLPLDGHSSSAVIPSYTITPKQGLETLLGAERVLYAKGCDINSTNRSLFAEAKRMAKNSEVVVFVGGLDNAVEGEGYFIKGDRLTGSVDLPGVQNELINELAAASTLRVEFRVNGRLVASGGGSQAGGPLFFTHYSFLGFDPRSWRDPYCNYFENNRAISRIHHAYAVANPGHHTGYGENVWGLTVSRGPDGYKAFEPRNDNGTVAPTAALSAMPYTPRESMAALKHYYHALGNRLWGDFGFKDAFNLDRDWFERGYLAIDQGPIVVMIENHCTGLCWQLFMANEEIPRALNASGWTKQ